MKSGFLPLRVAAISMNAAKWDKAGNAENLERFFREAAERNSQVAVAPEGALEGLAGDSAEIDYEHMKDRIEMVDRVVEAAEPLDGPYINRFRELAKHLGMCLCFGFAELRDDTVFNTAVFIDSHGNIYGTHQKMHEAPSVGPLRWCGNTMRAIRTPYGKAGILICADRWTPMVARTLVLDGAQVLYVPTHGDKTRAENNRRVIARARENGVPVVQANFGANLIVSKGEIVAYQWGANRVTTAVIDVPIEASRESAKQMEQEFLDWRERHLLQR